MKEELENRKAERSILLPFLAGGLIGAGVALLFAPKSGKELRKDIKDLASTTREKAVSAVDKGKELYEGGISAVRNAIDAGKTAFVEERDRLRKVA